MYYDDNGQKVKASSFRFGGVSEGYNYDKKNMWMWWVLIALFVISVILFIMWMMKRNKKVKMGMW